MTDTADDTPGPYVLMAVESPWSVVTAALEAEGRGEPLSDDLRDGVETAGTLLVCSVFVQGGVPVDVALQQFEERDHSFRLTYDPATNEVGLTVEWEDGTSAAVMFHENQTKGTRL